MSHQVALRAAETEVAEHQDTLCLNIQHLTKMCRHYCTIHSIEKIY